MDFSTAQTEAALTEDAQRLQCRVTTEQLDRLVAYAELLWRWNRRIRLVGSRTTEELARVHLADGLAVAARLQRLEPAGASLIDVGTGAGLPGIVIQVLVPELQVTLCEIADKRIAFLRQARRTLDGSFRVVQSDVRQLVGEGPAFDHAVSRATFEPDAWLSLARSLIGTRGTIWLMLTQRQREQWSHGGQEHRYQVLDKERVLISLAQAEN